MTGNLILVRGLDGEDIVNEAMRRAQKKIAEKHADSNTEPNKIKKVVKLEPVRQRSIYVTLSDICAENDQRKHLAADRIIGELGAKSLDVPQKFGSLQEIIYQNQTNTFNRKSGKWPSEIAREGNELGVLAIVKYSTMRLLKAYDIFVDNATSGLNLEQASKSIVSSFKEDVLGGHLVSYADIIRKKIDIDERLEGNRDYAVRLLTEVVNRVNNVQLLPAETVETSPVDAIYSILRDASSDYQPDCITMPGLRNATIKRDEINNFKVRGRVLTQIKWRRLEEDLIIYQTALEKRLKADSNQMEYSKGLEFENKMSYLLDDVVKYFSNPTERSVPNVIPIQRPKDDPRKAVHGQYLN